MDTQPHVSGQANKPLPRPPHALPAHEVCQLLEVNEQTGLNGSEAEKRSEEYGHNELLKEKNAQPLKIFIRQVANAMTLVGSRLLVSIDVPRIRSSSLASSIVFLVMLALQFRLFRLGLCVVQATPTSQAQSTEAQGLCPHVHRTFLPSMTVIAPSSGLASPLQRRPAYIITITTGPRSGFGSQFRYPSMDRRRRARRHHLPQHRHRLLPRLPSRPHHRRPRRPDLPHRQGHPRG